MKVIREQLIEAAITYTDFQSKYNRSALNEKTNFFGLSFLLFFLDCRSTNQLRLFSGNLPAINSRTAIAGAIIGLLLVFFYFVVMIFFYDHMTSQPLFVHSFMQFQLNCMCDVIFCS